MKKHRPNKRREQQKRPQEKTEQPSGPAAKYWETIESVTKGRYLHGTELAIAEAAWNDCVAELSKNQGKINLPDSPKGATIPQITPIQLTQVAISLAALHQDKPTSPIHAHFPEARDVLIRAASFLKDIGQKAAGDFLNTDGVSFEDILTSNQEKNTSTLKFLPGFTGGTQSVKSDRFKGLIGLIRRYFQQPDIDFKESALLEVALPKDVTGERFIKAKFLPTGVLILIRAWLYHQRNEQKKEKSKGNQPSATGQVNKNGLSKSGTSAKKVE